MIGAQGTMSALEGVRIVLAVAGIILTTGAAIFAHHGSMVFASPIRGRMIARRRVQMAAYLVIFGLIGGQTIMAAGVPDPASMSGAGLLVGYVLVTIEAILIVVTIMFSFGWRGTEAIVGDTPLQPDADQVTTQASIEARDILHEADNRMALGVGYVNLTLDDVSISPHTRKDMSEAVEALMSATELYGQAHELIRSQSAAVVPPRER